MLNSHSNIIIFSKPIHSGKTTTLFQYIKNNKHIGGFLMPDVDGKRMLYDIAKKKYHPFETLETDKSLTQQIGRFIFLQAAFEKGKNIISQYNNENIFIIDEVGKLEIEMDKGFEPMIKKIITDFKTNNYKGTLLLVIRDTLLKKAIEKYNLQQAEIIDHL
jgi:nucleoside-triphosphatase THEP1